MHTFGKEKDIDKFTGGAVYVDHASGLVFPRMQVALTAGDTLRGKNAFERFSAQMNVKIKTYHGDNGIFRSAAWKEDCELKGQQTRYSATGAHHQNGIAERAIRTIIGSACTMMLHLAIH